MNALVENGIISEMECGNNFAYIINDSNLYLTTEYKKYTPYEGDIIWTNSGRYEASL